MGTGCHHFDDGSCRSCPLLGVPYEAQLARKDAEVQAILRAVAGDIVWLPPVASPQFGFRNKAKMVVSGTAAASVLGLPPPQPTDLTDCPLYPAVIRAAFGPIKQFISEVNLLPYDLSPSQKRVTPTKAAGRGELKNVVVTAAPSGELLVQFVLRSRADEARIRSKLPILLAALPNLKVVSLNIHPEHKAVLAGAQEIVLTEQRSLKFDLGDFSLYVGPQSFFQTNTYIASLLYAAAAEWLSEVPARTIWDLYCGIGGFALAVSGEGREVTGVEISADAIRNAKRAKVDQDSFLALRDPALPVVSRRVCDAPQPTVPQDDGRLVSFLVGDATAFANAGSELPDIVIVNPPRRGLGNELVQLLNYSGVPTILYSSCNPKTLTSDIQGMSNYRIAKAQDFDMFPNTNHCEVLTLLRRIH